MILLDNELSDTIEAAEESPLTVSRAKQLLESALVQQFERLADGLMATLIITHGNLSEARWNQYLALGYSLDNRHSRWPNMKEVQSWFARRIADGSIRPINLTELGDVYIRIINGSVPLWDDQAINRQLRRLASSVRLVLLGSNELTALGLKSFLGIDNSESPIDGRFILGRVGNCTCTVFGPLFEIRQELAVSPYMESDAAGFSFGDAIGIRDSVLFNDPRSGLSLEGTRLADARSTNDELFGVRLQTLIHELIHASSHEIRDHPQHLYASAFCMEMVEDDLCRFTRDPRTLQECEAAFRPYVDLPDLVLKQARLHGGATGLYLKFDIPALVKKLVGEGRLAKLPNDRFSSAHQEEMQIWDL